MLYNASGINVSGSRSAEEYFIETRNSLPKPHLHGSRSVIHTEWTVCWDHCNSVNEMAMKLWLLSVISTAGLVLDASINFFYANGNQRNAVSLGPSTERFKEIRVVNGMMCFVYLAVPVLVRDPKSGRLE